MADLRGTQAVEETLYSTTADLRGTQAVEETLVTVPVDLRGTHAVLEVLLTEFVDAGNAPARRGSWFAIDVAPLATFTMTNEQLMYPASAGNNRNVEDPILATTTSTVITMTWPSAQLLECVSIHNHNLVGATVWLSNSAGFAKLFTIPARSPDGQCENPWLDLLTLSNTTAAVWTLTVTGASARVAIGEIGCYEVLHRIRWRPVEFSEDHLDEPIPMELLNEYTNDHGIRIRRIHGLLKMDVDRVLIHEQAWQQVKGRVWPFLLIPDATANSAWYVIFEKKSITWQRTAPGASPMDVSLRELSMGLPL